MVNLIENDPKPVTVDRSRLGEIPTPRPTLSWTPLPHDVLMDRVEDQVSQRGYRIQDSRCLLTHGGDRFLGTVTISNRNNLGYRRMIGVRNSHDKTRATGLIAGVRVIVCSNGMFTGDQVCLSRKHTSRLFDDLDEKIEAGFEKVFSEWERNDLRILSYREKELSDADAHDLVVRSMDADAVAPSALPRVLKEYREPWHEEFMPRTAWSLYNAFTEVMKGLPHLLPERTRALTRCFDKELGIA